MPRPLQIHPRVNPALAEALIEFSRSNGLTLNQACVHVLTLGLKEMRLQYGGSIMHYLNNISLKDQGASR